MKRRRRPGRPPAEEPADALVRVPARVRDELARQASARGKTIGQIIAEATYEKLVREGRVGISVNENPAK